MKILKIYMIVCLLIAAIALIYTSGCITSLLDEDLPATRGTDTYTLPPTASDWNDTDLPVTMTARPTDKSTPLPTAPPTDELTETPLPTETETETIAPTINPTANPTTAPIVSSDYVEYRGDPYHVFFHYLIAWPEVAYAPGNNYGKSLSVDCITPTEYWRSLEELYKNNYVIVDINR